MKVKCFLALLCFCGLWGCNRGGEKGNLPFTIDDAVSLQGEVIFEEQFWGNPARFYVLDSLLFVADKYDGKHLTILNLNTGQEKRAIDFGDGPEDLMQVRDISYNKQTGALTLWDSRLKKVSAYSVEGDTIYRRDAERISREDYNIARVYDVIPFSGGYISNGCFVNGEQFVWLNKGKEPVFFGEYPGDKTGIEIGGTFFLKTQTIMAANPNQEYFAAAGVFDDQLVFYRQVGEGFQKTKEYFSIDSQVETRYNKQGNRESFSSSITPETIHAYQALYPTESYLYAAYWGISEKELDEQSERATYIMKFDWNGTFCEGYMIPRLISRFAVDENRECLYTTILNGEDYNLVQYKM